MRRLYKEGDAAEIVERMAAIALQVDDDGALDAWIFATEFARLPPLRVAEIEAWTRDNVRMHEAVAADGSRVSLGGCNNEPQVIQDILAHYEARPGRAGSRAVLLRRWRGQGRADRPPVA